tara:strand:- start:936 stop:1058 length:123 start_codon:yes stop_codon:yes gene_type:complete
MIKSIFYRLFPPVTANPPTTAEIEERRNKAIKRITGWRLK